MTVETMEELVAAFSNWRSEKKHRRDRTPEDLVKRARAVARIQGVGRVAQAVKIDARHLIDGSEYPRNRGGMSSKRPPAYSKVELTAPSARTAGPLAELELPSGVRLRLYAQTPEMVALISSVCTERGTR